MFPFVQANTNLYKVSDLQLLVQVNFISEPQYNEVVKNASDYKEYMANQAKATDNSKVAQPNA